MNLSFGLVLCSHYCQQVLRHNVWLQISEHCVSTTDKISKCAVHTHSRACVQMIECGNNSHTSLPSLFASHEIIIFLSQLSPSASLLSVTQDSFHETGSSRGEMMTVYVCEMYFYYRSKNVLRVCEYIMCTSISNHICVFTMCSCLSRHSSSNYVLFFPRDNICVLTCDADVRLAAFCGSRRAPGHTLTPVIFRTEQFFHLLPGYFYAGFSHYETWKTPRKHR